jgi:hypothetical protein
LRRPARPPRAPPPLAPNPDGGDHLGDELRSLLRALLLCSIVGHRRVTMSIADQLAVAAAERALARLDVGRYGCCEQCAATMPLDELLAVPQAERCGRCRSC